MVHVKNETKILLINITLLILILVFQPAVSAYLLGATSVFAVALVCSFLSSLFLFFEKNQNLSHYLLPGICLVLGYIIFWRESDFISWLELAIGIGLGVLLYTVEIAFFKKSLI